MAWHQRLMDFQAEGQQRKRELRRASSRDGKTPALASDYRCSILIESHWGSPAAGEMMN